jgi:hypothetical protein
MKLTEYIKFNEDPREWYRLSQSMNKVKALFKELEVWNTNNEAYTDYNLNLIVKRINNPNTSTPLKILSRIEVNTLMEKQKEEAERDKIAAARYKVNMTGMPDRYVENSILHANMAERNMRVSEAKAKAEAEAKAVAELVTTGTEKADGEAGRVSGETATTNKLNTYDPRDRDSAGGTKRRNYKRKTTRRRRRR